MATAWRATAAAARRGRKRSATVTPTWRPTARSTGRSGWFGTSRPGVQKLTVPFEFDDLPLAP